MSGSPLIGAQELAAQLGACVVVDCRFDLMDIEAGRRSYAAGHIPGARYADLEHDLSGPRGPGLGRHPLPEPAALTARLSAWGVTNASAVVAYDAGSGAFAARLWWLLRWLGHESVRVLDGGFAAWEASQLPVERESPRGSEGKFRSARVHCEWVAAAAEIVAWASAGLRLIDVRTAARFAGIEEPIDPVAGHVPGAINYPFAQSLGEDGRFLPAPALRRQITAMLADHAPEEVVAMCGSGVTACHLLLAMAAAGLPAGRLYAGSWSEWISDAARPIAIGVRET